MNELMTIQDSAGTLNPQCRQSELLQLVTFGLDSEEYGVDILKVQEINIMKEITKVPHAAPWVEGVINLRGKVVPVIDLRKKCGLRSKENDAQSRIMMMDVNGVTMGFIVDVVSEVLRIPSAMVDPTPPMFSDAGMEYIKGIAKLEERLIMLLDVDCLISKEQYALTFSCNEHL